MSVDSANYVHLSIAIQTLLRHSLQSEASSFLHVLPNANPTGFVGNAGCVFTFYTVSALTCFALKPACVCVQTVVVSDTWY